MAETLRELEEEMLTTFPICNLKSAISNPAKRGAALLHDQIKELKRQFGQASGPAKALASQAGAVNDRKGTRKRAR
ncbi:MAG: hypothetical protein HZA90_15445 [Verrucomicrobia bacterium]|nr:hypothetical protein [Verrucomicrobiota bacterium]